MAFLYFRYIHDWRFTIGRSGSNTNLCLIQMGSIHLEIYPSLHKRSVSSRSSHCFDALFRTNSELTYIFPNRRIATHMRTSSFNLHTIRQCSRPFKTVGKTINVASLRYKPQIQLVYINYQCDKPSLQGNPPINRKHSWLLTLFLKILASLRCEAIHTQNCTMYLASPLLPAIVGEQTTGFGVTWQLQRETRLIGYNRVKHTIVATLNCQTDSDIDY